MVTQCRSSLARCLSIAAAVLLTAATSAAQQPTAADADLAAWAASGFNAEEARSWKRVGINRPDEARQWVDAGIQFAEWANQWRGEGFGAADARVWAEHQVNVYTAADFRTAGFGIAEATSWIVHGVRSALRAKEFRDRGFSPGQADDWWRLEFFPADAALWRNGGFTADEALTWRYGEKQFFYERSGFRGFSRDLYAPEWATEWRAAGFTVEQARRALSYRIPLDEAANWQRVGFSFEDSVTWRDAGFTPIDAGPERHKGLSPVEAEAQRDEAAARQQQPHATLHTDITLKSDGTLDVTETLAITNRAIESSKPCFSRSFPATITRKLSAASYDYAWPLYSIRSVTRDGAPAEYSLEKKRGGDITLCARGTGKPQPAETQTWTVSYSTDDHVINLHERDRLYFDVRGDLSIELRRASATVHLPFGLNTAAMDGFAGPPYRKYFTADVRETADGDVIDYVVTRTLKDDMRFDVGVTFPQGFVRPGFWRRVRRLDHETGRVLSSLAVLATGLIAAAVYFIWVWRRVGRDPRKAVVVAAYEPPDGVSPALMRYIVTRRRVDDRSIAATLVRVAHGGALVIAEREGRYKLEKTGKPVVGCAPHESEFFDRLFSGRSDIILGTKDARNLLRAARSVLRLSLRTASRAYFASNRRYLWPGVIVSVASAVWALAVVDFSEMPAGWPYFSFVGLLVVVLDGMFWWLIKAPTATGRKVLDQIAGYRQFLEANFRETRGLLETASSEAPPTLAAHLPYAIACGVGVERTSIARHKPTWFAGRSGGFSAADFTGSLRKLTPRVVHL